MLCGHRANLGWGQVCCQIDATWFSVSFIFGHVSVGVILSGLLRFGGARSYREISGDDRDSAV